MNDIIYMRLTVTNASKTFGYANDVIYCPGDFTPGTPTVLDRSDPYALSNAYLGWLKNGVGSLRFIDSLFGFGGMSPIAEPEQVFRLADYSWGFSGGKISSGPSFTQARPWDPASHPYFYTTLFGSPYSATLASPIDASSAVLTISDAATAPVIIGLRLKAGSELMRVLWSRARRSRSSGAPAARRRHRTRPARSRCRMVRIPRGRPSRRAASSSWSGDAPPDGERSDPQGGRQLADVRVQRRLPPALGQHDHELRLPGPSDRREHALAVRACRQDALDHAGADLLRRDASCKLGVGWPDSPGLPDRVRGEGGGPLPQLRPPLQPAACGLRLARVGRLAVGAG